MKEIYDAYRKELDVSDVSRQRYAHCLSCTLFNNDRCDSSRSGINILSQANTTGCGCVMSVKTKLEKAQCPLSKW